MKTRIMAVMVAACLSVTGLAYGELKDNGNGTITDTTQGLVWLKDANCYGLITWYSAYATKAPSLQSGQCGLSDNSRAGQWRLPTKVELLTRTGNRTGFTNVQPHGYWSSNTSDYSSYSAWAVSMGSGYAYGNNKGNTLYLWPVRTK